MEDLHFPIWVGLGWILFGLRIPSEVMDKKIISGAVSGSGDWLFCKQGLGSSCFGVTLGPYKWPKING